MINNTEPLEIAATCKITKRTQDKYMLDAEAKGYKDFSQYMRHLMELGFKTSHTPEALIKILDDVLN